MLPWQKLVTIAAATANGAFEKNAGNGIRIWEFRGERENRCESKPAIIIEVFTNFVEQNANTESANE